MSRFPPQWLLLRLDPQAAPAARRLLLSWLAATLPHLDWRCHLVCAGGDPEQTLAVAQVVADHVDRHPFVTVRLQPCLDHDLRLEDQLLHLAGRFQTRAYREQSEPGYEFLPVLTPAPDTASDTLVAQVTRLRARLAEPRLVVPEAAADTTEAAIVAARLGELRRDLLPAGAHGPDAVISLLGAGLVLESAVEGLAGEASEALSPCRPHMVADQARGLVFPCARAFIHGLPAIPLELNDGDEALQLEPPAELCPACYAASTLAAAPGLAVSGRRSEATAAALRLAVALAGRNEPTAAASCAACAAGLADSAEERAGALVLEGLCRQRAGELDTAAQRLRQGLDAGVAATERPRVLLQLAACLDELGRLDEAAAVTAAAAAAQHDEPQH